MSAAGVTFVTYLWHYLVARLIYDDLVRPVANGRHLDVVIGVVSAGAAGFLVGRRR